MGGIIANHTRPARGWRTKAHLEDQSTPPRKASKPRRPHRGWGRMCQHNSAWEPSRRRDSPVGIARILLATYACIWQVSMISFHPRIQRAGGEGGGVGGDKPCMTVKSKSEGYRGLPCTSFFHATNAMATKNVLRPVSSSRTWNSLHSPSQGSPGLQYACGKQAGRIAWQTIRKVEHTSSCPQGSGSHVVVAQK